MQAATRIAFCVLTDVPKRREWLSSNMRVNELRLILLKMIVVLVLLRTLREC